MKVCSKTQLSASVKLESLYFQFYYQITNPACANLIYRTQQHSLNYWGPHGPPPLPIKINYKTLKCNLSIFIHELVKINLK